MSGSIIVLGVEITEKDFPELYRMVNKNTAGLVRLLKGVAKANGGRDYESAAVLLESDLEHEHHSLPDGE
jgi:hypothetical protein